MRLNNSDYKFQLMCNRFCEKDKKRLFQEKNGLQITNTDS